jgi:protein-disulfide isomerase
MRFDRQMLAHAYAALVREQLESGLASRVQGMPTFFIGGVRHDGSYDPETLLAAMEGGIDEPSEQGSR